MDNDTSTNTDMDTTETLQGWIQPEGLTPAEQLEWLERVLEGTAGEAETIYVK